MAREQIAMTRAEMLAFLDVQRWVLLATIDPDGAPAGDVVPAALADGALCFAVERGGRAHANVGRDPRVCCAADEFPTYYEIRGVTAHGVARASTDPQLAARFGPERAVYTLPLDDTFSFDFRKIRRKY